MSEEFLSNPPPFQAYGTQHFVSLLIGAAVLIWLIWTSRSDRFPKKLERGHIALMIVILLICWPLNFWTYPKMGYLRPWPMHLCDLAGFAGVIALITRRPLFAELTYFWGLAGTINGLITPDLAAGFPHPRFFAFFLLHLGVVITAVWLVVGLKIRPRKHSIWKIFALTQVYVIVASLVNWITKHNYGFLRHKPENAGTTPLDFLGPWPIYIIWLEVITLVLFLILYLPWWIRAKRQGQWE